MGRGVSGRGRAFPAHAPQRLAAQLGMELRLTARRGENVVVTLVVPVALLVFFVTYPIAIPPGVRAVDAVVPGILAVAIIAAGLVNLGIATAYERAYGVLKRLGATPLTPLLLVVAKVAAVVLLEVVQVVLVIAVAGGLLGWRPASVDLATIGAALVLGTAAFAGLGLLLAGTLRAEATLALANALFLALVLAGGVVVVPTQLPEVLAGLARVLPAAALADALRVGFGAPADPAVGGATALAILAAWAVAAIALAARLFRWE